ncbi:cystin-1 [Pipra filicauda]|uniref:Cystin-1 n=1 Tax=Pipra filicauda TaxID=649802 RepID=A0A7R5KGX3_9PASS|nr:cystin-1 [Pipra filicauda]
MGSGSSRRRGAAGPKGRAAENRELPETAPAESEGVAAPALACPASAAGGIPEPRAAGSCGAMWAGGGGAPLQQAALSTRSSPGPENNNADHQGPESNSKKPSGQSTISYDYSEEELMASIEREYCR